jgi:reactive intermediate/imine deaminase
LNPRAQIRSDRAPAPVGPYSQAIVHAGLLYCSGSLPFDPETGQLDAGSLDAETRRSLANLGFVCEAAGTSLERGLMLTIYTTQLESFAEINEAYASFFGDDPPARAAVGVAALPKGARVEISALVAIAG